MMIAVIWPHLHNQLRNSLINWNSNVNKKTADSHFQVHTMTIIGKLSIFKQLLLCIVHLFIIYWDRIFQFHQEFVNSFCHWNPSNYSKYHTFIEFSNKIGNQIQIHNIENYQAGLLNFKEFPAVWLYIGFFFIKLSFTILQLMNCKNIYLIFPILLHISNSILYMKRNRIEAIGFSSHASPLPFHFYPGKFFLSTHSKDICNASQMRHIAHLKSPNVIQGLEAKSGNQKAPTTFTVYNPQVIRVLWWTNGRKTDFMNLWKRLRGFYMLISIFSLVFPEIFRHKKKSLANSLTLFIWPFIDFFTGWRNCDRTMGIMEARKRENNFELGHWVHVVDFCI